MSLSQWFGWNRTESGDEIPEIYPVPIMAGAFVDTDIVTIFSKVLTDTIERTQGLTDDQVALLWDNCVKSSKSDGLVSLLAKSMSAKGELFLVYEAAVGVVRVATSEEQGQIKADYAKQGQSKAGVYISFANFKRADMVKFYLGLEYCTVASLYKSMNLSRAVQLKVSDLRSSVSLADADDAKVQAQRVAQALGAGRDILIDAKDKIETAVPDLSATKEAIAFVVSKLSFYLGLPDSYLTGIQTGGIGSSGENDMRAVERGLKSYYFSIIKPTLEALFGVKTAYKSQDFRQIESAGDILKTFALIDDTMVSADNKRMIVNKLLDLPEDAKGDAPKPQPAPALPAPIPPAKP